MGELYADDRVRGRSQLSISTESTNLGGERGLRPASVLFFKC